MNIRQLFLAAALLSFVACARGTSDPEPAEGSAGEAVAQPEAALLAAVAAENTKSMVVLRGGETVFAYGLADAAEPTYTASVRKSILTMLMGEWVENGEIELDATLADLGVDDVQGLTDDEKRATVRDLISARSGVYHPASNFSGVTDAGPQRGDHAAGTYYWYNNWDFNAAGWIFEKLTGRSMYDEFERQFVGPMGLQPFDVVKHKQAKAERSRENSLYPPYHFLLSANDLAKLGQLMLQKGVWNGERLMSEEWVEESVSLVTRSAEMNPESNRNGELGYGYMWWVFDPATAPEAFHGGYAARGHFGQYILVLPKLDMVIAHKTAPQEYDGPEEYDAVNVNWEEFRALVDLAVAAFGR
ncbi:MAG: serine hydrolase [Pseudomonadota bacterium]